MRIVNCKTVPHGFALTKVTNGVAEISMVRLCLIDGAKKDAGEFKPAFFHVWHVDELAR